MRLIAYVLQCRVLRSSIKLCRHYITYELDTNTHSVFLLNYHLILVVKYLRNVFDDQISGRARAIFERIAPDYIIGIAHYWGRFWAIIIIAICIFFRTSLPIMIGAFLCAKNLWD